MPGHFSRGTEKTRGAGLNPGKDTCITPAMRTAELQSGGALKTIAPLRTPWAAAMPSSWRESYLQTPPLRVPAGFFHAQELIPFVTPTVCDGGVFKPKETLGSDVCSHLLTPVQRRDPQWNPDRPFPWWFTYKSDIIPLLLQVT